MEQGLVQVYTGDGKGKTSAALGLALRAGGHNYTSYMIQFLKSGDTGELFAVQKYIPFLKIVQFGKDALKEKQMKIYKYAGKEADENKLEEEEVYIFLPDEEEKEACRRGFEHAKGIVSSGRYDIVILDEINCAMDKKLIDVNDVIELIKNKPKHVELVLTGRGAPHEIKELADYVSENKRLKHPYDRGIMARKGIEY